MGKRKYNSYQEEEMRIMEKKFCEKHRKSEDVKCWSYDCHDECDCKKDHKKGHKKDDKKDGHKDRADLKDFEFYTLDPNVQQDNRFELPVDVQTPVASVKLDKVKKGDVVWLNGVFGLDNDDPDDYATIIMRIYKGSPSVFIPGEEIYRAVIEIDDAGNDDQVVEPLAHVDVISKNDENVTYTVTLETDEDPVYLNGPVTFTAALISKR